MKDLNNISDEEFDDVFRQSANEHNEELWEDAWPLMNEKLDQEEKKRRFVVFWRWAAALLLFGALGIFSTYYFKNDRSLTDKTEPSKIEEASININKKTGIDPSNISTKNNFKETLDSVKQKEINRKPFPKNINLYAKKTPKTKPKILDNQITKDKQIVLTENKLADISTKNKDKFEENNYNNILEKKSEIIAIADEKTEIKEPTLIETKSSFTEEDTVIVTFDETTISSEGELFEDLPITNSNSSPFRNFGLILGFSPDYSKVATSPFGPMGHNLQILLNYNLTKKISLKAGVIKSLKIYDAYPENYAWPAKWGTPSSPLKEVSATCNMLDIPVVISYEIKEKGPNKLYSSIGITSYKMMNEKYIYHYENDNDPNLKWKKWEGSTGFFGNGVMNFSLGLERKVSKSISVQLEPFLKIPIKNIGFGNVKLYTTGLFLNIKTATR